MTIREITETVRRDGAAVWPGYLAPDRCTELHQIATALATGPHARPYPKSTRVWDLYRHGDPFVGLLTDTRLTAVVTELLGEHHLLSDYSLNVVQPDQPIDDWHIDYPHNEMPTPVHGALLGLQCVLTLSRFTTDTGATQYLPGTYQTPRRPDPAQRGVPRTFTAAPGSLLIMAAATWHRSGRNTSTGPRTAILLSYVERWIRPMADPPEPGPWSTTQDLRLLLGMQRPPETINGVPL